MKRTFIMVLVAFIAITTLTMAKPNSGLNPNSILNAFIPNHITGNIHRNNNTINGLNAINKINTSKQKLDSLIGYDKDFFQGIKIDPKMTFLYNQIGQAVSSTMKMYLSGTSNLVYNFSNIFEYDQNGRMIKNTEKSDQNVNSNLTEYEYNESNLITVEKQSSWDDVQNIWVISSKNEYTYNENGLLITKLEQSDASNGEFGLTNRYEYSYDSESKITEVTQYYLSDKWYKNGLDIYEYDQNKNLISLSNYYFENDGNGNEIKIISTKESYSYDNNNNRYMTTSFAKAPTGDEIIPTSKEVYKYNNDYALSDLILPFTPNDNDFKASFNHMIVLNTSYTFGEGTLADSSESKFYYSEFNSSSVFDRNFSTANVSPNPADEYLSFNWISYELTLDLFIYDLSGQEVFSETITKGEPVQLSALTTGAYLYKLGNSGKILYGGKILIK